MIPKNNSIKRGNFVSVSGLSEGLLWRGSDTSKNGCKVGNGVSMTSSEAVLKARKLEFFV
jgi:hypothetical protein